MEKLLLFPGGLQRASNYRGFDGVDIWLRSQKDKPLPLADCYIGHSLGASFLLASQITTVPDGGETATARFIFANPLLVKRSLLGWLYHWIKFHLAENTFGEKRAPATEWIYAFKLTLALLKLDTIAALERLPKEKVLLIRGKRDNFFFDARSAENMRRKGFKVIEVDSGHSWNENMAEAVRRYADLEI